MTTSDPMMKRASASFLPPIALDNHSPMYRQLYDWFRTAILEGQLKPGRRVPSTRSLAAELKVSRITVLSAFEQLYAEGYLETSVGSGTYVSRSIPDDLVTLRKLAPRDRTLEGGQPPRRLTQRSGLRKVSRFGMALLSAPPEPWSNRLGPFSVSTPALDHFPFGVWSRLVIRHSRQPANELLAYSDPTGHRPFREAIAEYVGTVRGVRCDPSQVMVVTGSQQALEISARVLLDPRDAVWIEEPIVPKDLVRAFSRARENSDLFSSTLYQAVLTDFIREGHLGRHIRRMRMLYANRRDALAEEIRKQIGTTIEIVAAKAGMHLIIRLPAKVDDVTVSQRASREGIAVMPLSICYQEKPRRGGLILGYGGTDQQQIREGTRKLASVLRPIGGSQ